MNNRIVKKFSSPGAMAACAAGIFARSLAAKKRGKFIAAVSGGRSPELLFKKLSALPLPWSRVFFFMADERLVAPSSPESNFGKARAMLFSKINIPRPNLHPVHPGRGAAAAYGRELLEETGGSGQLDFVLLGLGEDGHTASLFPGSAALKEKKSPVCAALAPRGAKVRRRVTFTLNTINRAAAVVLIAAGPAKKKMFERALLRDRTIPAGLLDPLGDLHLLFSEKE